MKNILILGGVALALMASQAGAAITYDFRTSSIYGPIVNGNSTSIPLELRILVSTQSFVATDYLGFGYVSTSCSSNSPGYDCITGGIRLFAQQFNGYDALNALISTPTNVQGPLFYFEDGAFGKIGTYSTVLFGSSQAATLTVSVAGAVPEPTTWTMLISGFALLGGVVRRRQRTKVRFV